MSNIYIVLYLAGFQEQNDVQVSKQSAYKVTIVNAQQQNLFVMYSYLYLTTVA